MKRFEWQHIYIFVLWENITLFKTSQYLYRSKKKSYGFYFLWAKKKNKAKADKVTGEDEIWYGTLEKKLPRSN